MIIPKVSPNAIDRLSGRAMRIGLKFPSNLSINTTRLPEGSDVVLGKPAPGVLAVREWTAPPVRLIEAGRHLMLGPGMRLIAVHEDGSDRMEGSFEELKAAGVSMPIFVNVSRLNIRVNALVTILIEYVTA